ncbi:MAG: gfo/Idh/MocA family oxidoreductase [Calditrichaeota bacterium]|nr:MAG: gfo/Idh/MocA family oxidoreductase [Calditrichota bacterium]
MKKNKISRRQFLKKSAGISLGALVAPTIVPSHVFGKPGVVAPNDKITIGCIGVGGMGTGNMRSFLELPDAQVVAVCDVDRNHAENAQNLVNTKYGSMDCAIYKDFRDVISRKDIDAVMIATPDHLHAIIAVAAARAGKDIYCEKPLAYTISEGRAVVDAVHRYDVVWQTGSWQRSQQHFRYACELVRSGKIGEVNKVHVGLPYGNGIRQGSTQPAPVPEHFDYNMWLGPAPFVPYNPTRCHWNFRWISDYSGGQLTDWAGHHIDIAHWGMNTEHSAAVEIEGRAVYPPASDGQFDTPNSYYFEAKYAEGFTMIVADSRQQEKGMGVHFMGSDGWIHVGRGTLTASSKSLLKTRLSANDTRLYISNDHRQNFLDCVRSREKTITPVNVAHHSIMTGHLGVIAMKLGRKLRFDVKKERFVNDADANRMLIRPMRSPWHVSI